MRFEWDPAKANLTKHGVPFGEAIEVFSTGDDHLEVYDEANSLDEDRFVAIGPAAGRIVVVAFAEQPEDTIRLISARRATRQEIRLYRESMKVEPDDR